MVFGMKDIGTYNNMISPVTFPLSTYYTFLLLHILQNSVPCGADGLLGDAHDAADVAVVQAHLVENEEEGVVGGLGCIFFLDATECVEVDGLVVVDEAFVVVV